MSYLVSYSLDWLSDNEEDNIIEDTITINPPTSDEMRWALCDIDGESLTYTFTRNDIGQTATTWYSREKDMRSFSRIFPQTIFILRGEEYTNEIIKREYYVDEIPYYDEVKKDGQVFLEYYKNGRMYSVLENEIYPEFNEQLLDNRVEYKERTYKVIEDYGKFNNFIKETYKVKEDKDPLSFMYEDSSIILFEAKPEEIEESELAEILESWNIDNWYDLEILCSDMVNKEIMEPGYYMLFPN